MTPDDTDGLTLTRRGLLRGGGALVVSFTLPAALAAGRAEGAEAAALMRPLSPAMLDSYLAIDRAGQVTAYFGKVDVGQGLDVAIAQVVAEELDVPLDRVAVSMGDTALSVNQGGASGSTGLEQGAKPLRAAAAEARKVLIGLASDKLGLPAGQLAVSDGVVHAVADPAQAVSYGDLIGGRHFDIKLKWNGKLGNALNVVGTAEPKRPGDYRIVGTPQPRRDLAELILGTQDSVVDVKLPGMMHGRVVRPPKAGAVPVSVDDTSLDGLRGARMVHLGDYLAVVAETEWDAIRAAERLQVAWSDPKPAFPESDALYDHIRDAPATRESAAPGMEPAVPPDLGPTEAALRGAARVLQAEYRFPFQSHASMGPACAVCDCRDGTATIWTASQKPHYTAEGVARILGLPVENVHGIWLRGPGSYGRNDAGDAAMDAALLSQAVGRPVRVQGMRVEGHAWDPKAPASIHIARAGFDDKDRVVAFSFLSKGFSAGDMSSNESRPNDTYAGMLTGWPSKSVHRFDIPEEHYVFPAKLGYWQTVAPLLDKASPLRTAHMRDPMGPQIHFAFESFIDEMAHAVGADPVEFRLRHLTEPRDIAVIKAAAERAGWTPRVAGPKDRPASGIVTGRGISYALRHHSVSAVIAEVEVDLATGRVWPRRFTVAADHGLVVNPQWLRRTVEGNIVMAASRSLCEEVQFTPEMVTSVDWDTYPILDMTDAPEEIDIVLLDQPHLPPYGGGEATTRPVPGAIANAIFDATGIRLRQAPMTPARVKEALGAARA